MADERRLTVMQGHLLDDCTDRASCWYVPHRQGKRVPDVVDLNCGLGTPHGPHEWRWRSAVIPPDLTGETTAMRACLGVEKGQHDG